jgi:hypothetical protein
VISSSKRLSPPISSLLTTDTISLQSASFLPPVCFQDPAYLGVRVQGFRCTPHPWSVPSLHTLLLCTNTTVLGSFHFTDVLAVFGILPTAPCKEMQARWTAFAYNLDRVSPPVTLASHTDSLPQPTLMVTLPGLNMDRPPPSSSPPISEVRV